MSRAREKAVKELITAVRTSLDNPRSSMAKLQMKMALEKIDKLRQKRKKYLKPTSVLKQARSIAERELYLLFPTNRG